MESSIIQSCTGKKKVTEYCNNVEVNNECVMFNESLELNTIAYQTTVNASIIGGESSIPNNICNNNKEENELQLDISGTQCVIDIGTINLNDIIGNNISLSFQLFLPNYKLILVIINIIYNVDSHP